LITLTAAAMIALRLSSLFGLAKRSP
jgi:hypothetical protein